MYHNIEKRTHAVTQNKHARYRGWDAAGRFWYVCRLTVRGRPYWLATLRCAPRTVQAATLRGISTKLAGIKA